jgi:hypothetical protein
VGIHAWFYSAGRVEVTQMKAKQSFAGIPGLNKFWPIHVSQIWLACHPVAATCGYARGALPVCLELSPNNNLQYEISS